MLRLYQLFGRPSIHGYALSSVGRLCASAGLSTCVSSLFLSKKTFGLGPAQDLTGPLNGFSR